MTRVTKEIACGACSRTVPRKVFAILLKNLNLIFLINRGIPCAKFVHNVGPDVAIEQMSPSTDVCRVNRP